MYGIFIAPLWNLGCVAVQWAPLDEVHSWERHAALSVDLHTLLNRKLWPHCSRRSGQQRMCFVCWHQVQQFYSVCRVHHPSNVDGRVLHAGGPSLDLYPVFSVTESVSVSLGCCRNHVPCVYTRGGEGGLFGAWQCRRACLGLSVVCESAHLVDAQANGFQASRACSIALRLSCCTQYPAATVSYA